MAVVWTRRLAGALAVALLCTVFASPASADKFSLFGKAVTPAAKSFEAGVIALDSNKLPAAEAAFKESLKFDAKSAAPYLGLAEVALRRGQTTVAGDHLKKALELAPATASIHTAWGAYLYSTRELPEAEMALRKATALDPSLVVAHIQLGDLYLVGFRKFDAAIAEYRTALKLSPNHAGAHYALGLALVTKGDPKGESELLEAIKLAPRNPLGYHTIGRFYSQQQRYDQALDAFGAALKVFPDFAAPHVERGNIFAAKGDDDRALVEYAKAQEKDPKRSVGFTNIGMVHQRRAQWAEAEKAYLSAIRVEPTNAVALNNLAWMAADRKVKLTEALAWATKAVSLAPDVAEFHGTLGWVYRARGDFAKAEQTLTKAANMKPERAAVVYTLARLHLEQGKTAPAVAALKRALAIDPKFPDADAARKKLKELGSS